MKNNIKLINFTDLTQDEKEMILEWRNHPNVKKWMYSSEDISLENHLNFIESLKTSSDKIYFLAKENNTYIGVIDFTNINVETCEFGLYQNTELKGYGKRLLESIIEYSFIMLKVKKLLAEVFSENEKAIKLYENFNLKEVTHKTVENQKIICMELENENR